MSGMHGDAEKARLIWAQSLPAGCADDFLRLSKTLLYGPPFQWLLANAPVFRMREQVIAALDNTLALAAMRPSRLNIDTTIADVADLELALVRHAANADVVHVIVPTAWFDAKRWDAFNVRRERIAAKARAKLLFWLDAEAISDASRSAPDLWAWRAGVYAFVEPSVTAVTESFDIEKSDAPVESSNGGALLEIEQRILQIESWLAAHPEAGDELLIAPLQELGQLYRDVGEYDRALQHLRGAVLPVLHRLGALLDAIITLIEIGDICELQGDLPMARNAYEQALETYLTAGFLDTIDAVYPRTLALIYERLGIISEMQGDLAAAQQRYEAGLQIIDTLVSRNPSDVGLQRDLSVSHNKLGNLLQAQGDFASAQQRYEAGLQIADALAQRDSDNATWQRDLSVSHNKLGDLLQAQGDLAAAQQRYEASLRIRDALVQRDPENAEWQRDLSVSFEKLGNLLKVQGDLAGAQQRYEASLRISDTLAQRDPDNAEWQRDLSVSFEKLGDLLQLQGDLAGAEQRYEASLRISDTLAQRDPDNAGWQRDWAVSFIKLGMVRGRQGDVAAMRSDWQQAYAIFERLVQRLPDHPQFRRELVRLQKMLASLEGE